MHGDAVDDPLIDGAEDGLEVAQVIRLDEPHAVEEDGNLSGRPSSPYGRAETVIRHAESLGDAQRVVAEREKFSMSSRENRRPRLRATRGRTDWQSR
jgi:hypothetical protein